MCAVHLARKYAVAEQPTYLGTDTQHEEGL